MSRAVLLIETGVANLASVRSGLVRAGAVVESAPSPEAVRTADRVMLPGVGAFGAAMESLERSGMGQALADRIAADRPTLAICVGLQVLTRSSRESPGVDGLGVIPADVARFESRPDVRVPQMGWNAVDVPAGSQFLEAGDYYFANSYAIPGGPVDGWLAATGDHGGTFVAALERGATIACQFHPELSGAAGARLLERWVEGA